MRFLTVFEPVDEVFERVFIETRAPGEIERRLGVAAFFADVRGRSSKIPGTFAAKWRTVEHNRGAAGWTDSGPRGMRGIVGRTDKTVRGIDQMTQTLQEVF